jgi:dynein heavy chain 1
MTLLSLLRGLPNTNVVSINFSSETDCDVIIRTLELHGTYQKTSSGEIYKPCQGWLVLFCDEINLPKEDKYHTQRVIQFLRQMIERGGFWRNDGVFVIVENVQIIGACNPPTDPGRHELSLRFLRHIPVVFVDYPNESSLITIYGTFCLSAMKCQPNLRGYSDSVTNAMVGFYLACQEEFTSDKQQHYIFSPRELTRWIRGIYKILLPLEFSKIEDLVRIWAHEGIRLFQDRLVDKNEVRWTETQLYKTASENFPGLNLDICLKQPILFSNFDSREYKSTDREVLREFIKSRQQSFYEEELNIQLVLFDSALEHILRIDRVFRQTQGHLLLIGISGLFY